MTSFEVNVILNLFFFSLIFAVLSREVYVFARGLLIGRKSHLWKCKRCGHCCSYNVRMSSEDIKRIQAAGHNDFLSGKYMKKVNGGCVFLRKNKGIAKCSIYNIRPRVCREFPFSRMLGRFDVAMNTICPEIKKLSPFLP
ncbi:MAG: YkgJ family cysteine cluster protein [Candidatus Aenigmatarchaeota archaeon]